MTLPAFFLYFTAGRLLIWLLQTNGLTQSLWSLHPKLKELSECDLCLGFWIYLGLGFFISLPPFGWWWWPVEVMILAAIATFGMHLLRLGWQARFGVIIDD